MNKKPVYYMQTDPRWKNKPYRVTGENSTIGGSGCGPSCAAMLIETLTGKTFTPEDACNWSMAHGYKALNQGTYYAYFVPQFKEFGISCQMINSANIYGGINGAASVHAKAFDLLKHGYYLIACMGPGNWTSSGHFVVVWWEDEKVRINDPASKKDTRLNGNIVQFKSQVKYYWAIDARKYNNATNEENKSEEEDDMTEKEVRAIVEEILLAKNKAGSDSLSDEWEEAKKAGITDGSRPAGYATREQVAAMIVRTIKE